MNSERLMVRYRRCLTTAIVPVPATQVFDVYGEEGLKGGAPPPGPEAAAGPAGAAGGPGFTSFTFNPGQGFQGAYSGVDAARAANIFAHIFGNGADGFAGFGAAPRSRVRMFSRKGSMGRGAAGGFDGVFEQMRQQQGAQQQYQAANSGTGGFAFGGGAGEMLGSLQLQDNGARAQSMVVDSWCLES